MGLLRGFPKSFQPWKNKFPREENKISTLGNFSFLRRKRKNSLVGNVDSPRGYRAINSFDYEVRKLNRISATEPSHYGAVDLVYKS